MAWPIGRVFPDSPDAYVRLEVFDDDGPEGFYERTFWRSSFDAATYFCKNFNHDYHCTITQR